LSQNLCGNAGRYGKRQARNAYIIPKESCQNIVRFALAARSPSVASWIGNRVSCGSWQPIEIGTLEIRVPKAELELKQIAINGSAAIQPASKDELCEPFHTSKDQTLLFARSATKRAPDFSGALWL